MQNPLTQLGHAIAGYWNYLVYMTTRETHYQLQSGSPRHTRR